MFLNGPTKRIVYNNIQLNTVYTWFLLWIEDSSSMNQQYITDATHESLIID